MAYKSFIFPLSLSQSEELAEDLNESVNVICQISSELENAQSNIDFLKLLIKYENSENFQLFCFLGWAYGFKISIEYKYWQICREKKIFFSKMPNDPFEVVL